MAINMTSRTGNSLYVKVIAPNRTEGISEFYYQVKSLSTGRMHRSKEAQVNVTDLEPFTMETLSASICIKETLCSESIEATFQTNVGGV